MSRIHRLVIVAGATLTTAAIAAGPAAADPHAQDTHQRVVAQQQDLRSPDTRDAAQGTGQDLRSPDARDAAVGRDPVVVQIDRASDGGLSWDSAGIGALVSAGLMFSLAGAFVLLSRRRRPTGQAGIGSSASAP
jgi:hypothetical protein